MKQRFAPPGMLAIAADSYGLDFDIFARTHEPFEMRGDFAVVAISGPLMQHSTWCWDSYEEISKRVQAAFLSPCPAVMLKICSPGGQVAGAFELASWIRAQAAREGKQVVAYVDGMAASAAYALACAADRIVVPPTGLVGSIGCIQVNVDATAQDRAIGLSFEMITSGARKADGNPHSPLSEESRTAMQISVNDMAGTFFETVASARKLTPDVVAAFEAGVFVGSKSVDAGLADEVMTFSELVLAGSKQINAGAAGAEADMTKEEEAKAALQAIADGDDEKAAAKAKKALAAYEEDDGDGDEKKKDEAKAESDDSKKEEPKKEDADAKAAAKAAPMLALVDSKIASFEERQERKELMASRPDFAPELVAVLNKSPISAVREAVKTMPKATPKSQVRDARAALSTTASIGAQPVEAPNPLDVQMGLARASAPISFDERTKIHSLGVMSPAEARAELARRVAAKGGA